MNLTSNKTRHIFDEHGTPLAANNLSARYVQYGSYRHRPNQYLKSLEAQVLYTLAMACECIDAEETAGAVLLVKAGMHRTPAGILAGRVAQGMPAALHGLVADGTLGHVTAAMDELKDIIEGKPQVPYVDVWKAVRGGSSGAGGVIGNGDDEIWMTMQVCVKTTDRKTGRTVYMNAGDAGYVAALAALASWEVENMSKDRHRAVAAAAKELEAKYGRGDRLDRELSTVAREQLRDVLDERLLYAVSARVMESGVEVYIDGAEVGAAFPEGVKMINADEKLVDDRFVAQLVLVITGGNIDGSLLTDDWDATDGGLVVIDPLVMAGLADSLETMIDDKLKRAMDIMGLKSEDPKDWVDAIMVAANTIGDTMMAAGAASRVIGRETGDQYTAAILTLCRMMDGVEQTAVWSLTDNREIATSQQKGRAMGQTVMNKMSFDSLMG